jgi:Rdx family
LNAEGFQASIREGRKSQFDVVRDGAVVYSKEQEHRFPEPGEVLALLRD